MIAGHGHLDRALDEVLPFHFREVQLLAAICGEIERLSGELKFALPRQELESLSQVADAIHLDSLDNRGFADICLGNEHRFFRFRRASIAIGKTPLIGRTSPLSASSPAMRQRPSRGISAPSATAIMPMAIGRSKLGPSFFKSAGARFTVVRDLDQRKPLLAMAVVTRSLLSRTAASGRPTSTIAGSPDPALTSIST